MTAWDVTAIGMIVVVWSAAGFVFGFRILGPAIEGMLT